MQRFCQVTRECPVKFLRREGHLVFAGRRRPRQGRPVDIASATAASIFFTAVGLVHQLIKARDERRLSAPSPVRRRQWPRLECYFLGYPSGLACRISFILWLLSHQRVRQTAGRPPDCYGRALWVAA
jgi:hypothetical protein